MSRFYRDLAPWWPLISDPDEYRDEAFLFQCTLEEAVEGPLRSILELGCGGGNVAGHLDPSLDLFLVDASAEMLEVALRRRPTARGEVGDMRSLRLGEHFDAVFIHDAIAYMTTEDDLHRALATARAHVGPGGAVLVVPESIAEQFGPSTECGGRDGEGRSARYLAWTTDPDPDDQQVTITWTFVLREDGREDRVVHEVHRWGLFPRSTWRRAFEAAGLAWEERTVDPDLVDPRYGNVMFLGRVLG